MINNKKGFTLVEILVALFLTGLVMAGLVGIWVSTANFASSTREEAMFRNLVSLTSKRIQKDITEASATETSSLSCGGTLTTVFRTYQNYVPGAGRCILIESTPAASTYSMTEYCYDSSSKTMYRATASRTCNQSKPACFCTAAAGNFVLNNLVSKPSASATYEVVNGIRVNYEAEALVGKNKRPVRVTHSKTYGQLAGN